MISRYIKLKDKMDWKSFGYGYLGGMAGIVVSHPFDTMKTHIQEGKSVPRSLMKLYRGISAPLVGVGLEKAMVFGVYHNTYAYTGSFALSGALSGLTASLVVTPFERMKILWQTGQNFVGSGGGIFKGIGATLTRETPGFAIYFSIYERLKAHDPNFKPVHGFVYGMLAGAGAWIFIYPQDRIKTHIQASRDIGYKQAIADIIAKGNIYRGFSLALLRAVPLHATAFMTMELCKKYL